MRKLFSVSLLLLFPLFAHTGLPLPDGIYAEFDTTHGTFTAELTYTNTPITVASFVSLAEGTRPWLNEDTGLIKQEPFFNGKIFHRIIPGFIIQGGSHNGTGIGGPGYSFRDEFDITLRHDPYVLSMANSGPWSNGSQFFITLASTPHLDDKHSVFGNIISGTNVVDTIAAVPTGAGGLPLTNVIMNAVNILRIGALAEAFDVYAHGLPVLTNLLPVITQDPFELSYDRRQFSRHSLAVSTNLNTTFLPDHIEHYESTNDTLTLPINTITNSSGDKAYYAIGEVQYDANAFHPPHVLTSNVWLYTITKGAPGHLILINFQSNGFHAVVQHTIATFDSNYLVAYLYNRDLPYKGGYFQTGTTVTNGLQLTNLKMAFPTTSTNGVFSATILGSTPISGSFAPF